MHEEDKVEGRNVSMYPDDWRVVERVARESNVKTLSGALRIIIQQWLHMRRAQKKARHDDV